MTTKFGQEVHQEEFTQTRLIKQVHVKNYKYYISTMKVPMPTKLGKMVTYLDELLLTRPDNHMITWACEITC